MSAPDPSHSAPTPAQNRAVRAVFWALGMLFTGLGFVGVFLPVLPTVPFLILAAACFARSSPRLEAWLIGHRHFGPLLRDWRLRGAIPMRGKLAALLGCALGFVLFYFGADHSGWLVALVAAIMLGGLGYVFSRPTA